MTDTDTFWTRRIVLTDHAIERARERLGYEGTDEEIIEWVVPGVRVNLAADRISGVQPNWTRSDNFVEPTPDADFYCWDAEAKVCWALIVQRNGTLRVTTLLLDYATYNDISAAAYVKPGMRRA